MAEAALRNCTPNFGPQHASCRRLGSHTATQEQSPNARHPHHAKAVNRQDNRLDGKRSGKGLERAHEKRSGGIVRIID